MDLYQKNILNETTYSRVRDMIRDDILSGHFAPGVRLRIVDLSQRYGVSQMPIREALQQLQGEGIITLLPQKGASVRKIDEKFINNMYDIRAAIETMLVRKGMELVTEQDVADMERIQAKYEEAVRREDVSDIMEYNLLFHRRINEIADNPEASAIFNRAWGLISSFRHKFGFDKERLKTIVSGHRELIDAFRRRDADKAVSIVAEHAEKAKQDWLHTMRK